MTEFLSQTLHGLTLGALFALVAIGYTMVFGIIKLINFAHSEFYMAGGFAGLLALLWLTGPNAPVGGAGGGTRLLLALAAAGCAVSLLAVAVERVAYRPIRGGGRISALLTAVGVSLLLQNVGITVFGSRQMAFPETIPDVRYPRTAVNLATLVPGQSIPQTIVYSAPLRDGQGKVLSGADGKPLGWITATLAESGQSLDGAKLDAARKAQPESVYAYPGVTISLKQLIVFAALAVSGLGLFVLVQRTRTGRAMRAVSHDMQAAALMGIDANRIVTITFAIGGALAGMGGVLAGGMFISTVDPLMGFMFGLKAFIAAVLGGIGNIPGALLGGLALGLVEQYAQHYADTLLFPGAGAYRDAIAFMILIAVLLVRPRGFFGKIEGEKV